MANSRPYSCSQVVTVIYEPEPGEFCQVMANLEEISTTSAVVLLQQRPRLGSPISLVIKGHDLFGVITSSLYDAAVGWLVAVTLDVDSTLRRESVSPKRMSGLRPGPQRELVLLRKMCR
jgi:hypothetical protein